MPKGYKYPLVSLPVLDERRIRQALLLPAAGQLPAGAARLGATR
jgi:hypothetical protein